MIRLRLNLFPDEFTAMTQACMNCLPYWHSSQLRGHVNLETQVLAEASIRLNNSQLVWLDRKVNKEYAHRIPVSLALALHSYLQANPLILNGLSLLAKIDRALINAHYTPVRHAHLPSIAVDNAAADPASHGGGDPDGADRVADRAGVRPAVSAADAFD